MNDVDTDELESFSWIYHPPDIAIKTLDRSAFYHHGSAIPIDIRFFFGTETMTIGVNRQIILRFGKTEYPAHIEMRDIGGVRTRLFWNADFSMLLRDKFKAAYFHFRNEQSDPFNAPTMQLRRLDEAKTSFEVEFNITENSDGLDKNSVRNIRRNPPWNRDELILALDLYFKVNPIHTSEKNADIVELSRLLNDFPLQKSNIGSLRFRNPNGVYMKLCNFLRFDPSYKGKGLIAGGKLEKEIWDEFSEDLEKLKKVAGAIKNLVASGETKALPAASDDDDDTEVQEGRILMGVHKRRERNRLLVKKKKDTALRKYGKLQCEACAFDFGVRYGSIGSGFIECHHRLPLSDLAPNQKTKLSDLCLVCANCHRVLHLGKKKRNLSVEELRFIVKI